MLPIIIESEGNDYLMLFYSRERMDAWAQAEVDSVEVPGYVLAATPMPPPALGADVGAPYAKQFLPDEIAWLREVVESVMPQPPQNWQRKPARSLSDLGNQSENSAGRGQILSILQVNSCSIDQESGEIWTVQTDLQQIYSKSDRLLERARSICCFPEPETDNPSHAKKGALYKNPV